MTLCSRKPMLAQAQKGLEDAPPTRGWVPDPDGTYGRPLLTGHEVPRQASASRT